MGLALDILDVECHVKLRYIRVIRGSTLDNDIAVK